CFGLRLFRSLNTIASLWNIEIVKRASASRARPEFRTQRTTAWGTNHVRQIEDWTVEAPDRQVVAVAVSNRARAVHQFPSHEAADGLQTSRRADGDAGRQACGYRQACGVHRRDQQSSLTRELLQLCDSRKAKPWTHILGLILRSEIWRLCGLLPGQRVTPI